MKHLFALFFLLTAVIYAAEVKFPRQQVPRANTIRVNDVVLNIDRASSTSRDWIITAKRGRDVRQAVVKRNGINRLYFPDLVLEIRNWNIPKAESWSILAETIGDYEIRTMNPAEVLSAPSAMRVTEKKVKDRTHYVFSNGWLTLECIPSCNGAIVSFKDELLNREFFRDSMKNRELNLKSFQNLGFVDLFDIWGKTPQAAMDWNVKNGLIRMQGESQIKKHTTFIREMKLHPGTFVFELKSAVRFHGGGNAETIELKHRPEFRMFKNGADRSFQLLKPDANDRLQLVTPKVGTPHSTTRNAYAVVDSAAGLLFGIRYQDHKQLYLWCDSEYFSPEAMGQTKISIAKNPSMALAYFLIHGMGRADFLGKNIAFALPEKTLMLLEGTADRYKIDCVAGFAIPAKKAAVTMTLKNENGKAVSSCTTSFVPPAPGFATGFPAYVNVKNIPAGKYTLNIKIVGDKKELLDSTASFRITARADVEKVGRYLARVNKAITDSRKAFRTSKNRQQIMKDFRRYIALREQLQALQKTGELLPDELRNDPLFKGL